MSKASKMFFSGNMFWVFVFVMLQAACAQTNKKGFESDWQKFVEQSELKHANIGFLVIDAQSGLALQEYESRKVFLPASVMKIITTAYALETLGPNYRFTTQVAYSGKPDPLTGQLNGNLYIIGGGDPTLGSKYFSAASKDLFKKTLAALKSRGIKKISGNIIAFDGIYGTQRAPSTWGWQDIANYYASGASGLSYADNEYSLIFDTRVPPGDTVNLLRQEPPVKGMRFINEVTAYEGDSDLSYIFGSEYSDLRYIRGKLPAGDARYTIRGSFPNPPLFLARRMKSYLSQNALTVSGEALQKSHINQTGLSRVVRLYSPGLMNIINVTNKHSINLYAEHLYRQPIAVKLPGSGIDAALDSMHAFWSRKSELSEAEIYADGAGLSPSARISPAHLADVLFYMKNRASFSKLFEKSLPVSGEQGTLRYFLHRSPAKGKFRLKSGSFTGIRAYAGYGTLKSGREVIVVLIVNNFTGGTYALRKKMAVLFEALYLRQE